METNQNSIFVRIPKTAGHTIKNFLLHNSNLEIKPILNQGYESFSGQKLKFVSNLRLPETSKKACFPTKSRD